MNTILTRFWFVVSLAVAPMTVFSQSAADYFPSEPGTIWKYNSITTLNDSTTQNVQRTDQLITVDKSVPGITKLEIASVPGGLQTWTLSGDTVKASLREPLDFFEFFGDEPDPDVSFDGITETTLFIVSSAIGEAVTLNKVRQRIETPQLLSDAINSAFVTVEDSIDVILTMFFIRQEDESITLPMAEFNTIVFDNHLSVTAEIGIRTTFTGVPTRSVIEFPFFEGYKIRTWLASSAGIVKQFSDTMRVQIDERLLPGNISIPDILLPGADVQLLEITPIPSSISDEVSTQLPNFAQLENNYPNPFNPETVIQFTLDNAATVEITVFDSMGRTVRLLTRSTYQSGAHQLPFIASNLASGTYFYKMTARSLIDESVVSQTRTMMLIK
ncbi:MAG: T9SS type A sorting domain-containing protein [Balneolales bacterium]|nr:T9SS type A sorting domain-containing protein [Balneolales bacterium]